ncbi:hypothetical protein MPSEU_000889900 [Mayamaea pseudoterrestris]|nr:hypothetical protein MPSEU_000889900 [Mayamaea pseudoterrestris]
MPLRRMPSAQVRSSFAMTVKHHGAAAAAKILVSLFLLVARTECFVLSSPNARHIQLFQSDGEAAATTTEHQEQQLLSLSLPKPLGILLEEMEEGTSNGVIIQQVDPGGSAFEHADQLQGKQLAFVQGTNVTRLAFDDVMQLIIDAPQTVDLQVIVSDSEQVTDEAKAPSVVSFDAGTPVTILFQQPGSADLSISAKVGDNLRMTLLENGVEVYQGLKQKLGNCGGGGTCTFCAMDIVESQGWLERSDYEDNKLAKFPQARLACLNTIQGPATIRKTQR